MQKKIKKKAYLLAIAAVVFGVSSVCMAQQLGNGQMCAGNTWETQKCITGCASGQYKEISNPGESGNLDASSYLVCVGSGATRSFQYRLLESIPGFYSQGSEMTDLPSLILSIYKFGIWTIGIAGFFMLVIGGFMYIASAGNTSTAGTAKQIIFDSLLGIIAAMAAYLFLYVINPDLTTMNIDFAEKVEVKGSEPESVEGTMATSIATVGSYRLDQAFSTAIQRIQARGIKLVVTDGMRNIEDQKALIRQNCGGYPATRACSPSTCVLRGGDPKNCPHTTGRAADIWALAPNGSQAVTMSQCKSNPSVGFNNQYQKALINAMRAEGFCVLSSEPWHFELKVNGQGMSGSCN